MEVEDQTKLPDEADPPVESPAAVDDRPPEANASNQQDRLDEENAAAVKI